MNWSDVLFGVLSIVLTAAVSFAVTKLTAWIDEKIGDKRAQAMLSSAVTLVSDVVMQTYQTYVEALKGQNAFTEQAQKAALADALAKIASLLPEKVRAFLIEHFGDLEGWLTTQIEAAIYRLKRGSEAVDAA